MVNYIGNRQDEPGASYIARKYGSAQNHTNLKKRNREKQLPTQQFPMMGHIKGKQEPVKGVLNDQRWNNMNNKISKLTLDYNPEYK